ncbi:MAG: hypothetical protein HY362_01830 [Candidatus Aenigmarchaeota archaeon]|nr:hypothetical protein [Candidatus Aenigmarchaeota archaeon]
MFPSGESKTKLAQKEHNKKEIDPADALDPFASDRPDQRELKWDDDICRDYSFTDYVQEFGMRSLYSDQAAEVEMFLPVDEAETRTVAYSVLTAALGLAKYEGLIPKGLVMSEEHSNAEYKSSIQIVEQTLPPDVPTTEEMEPPLLPLSMGTPLSFDNSQIEQPFF